MHRRCKSLIGVLCCSLICANTPMVFASSSNGIASTSKVGEVKVGEAVMPAPMLATIATLAVASGITLSSDDDIYDIGRLFYDYVKNSNDLVWDSVVSIFESSVAFNNLTKQVTIGSEFGSILKGFFDSTFKTVDDKVGSGKVVNVGTKNGYPDLTGQISSWFDITFNDLKQIPGVNIEAMSNGSKVSFSNLYTIEKISSNSFKLYNNQGQLISHYKFPYSSAVYYTFCIYYFEGDYYARMTLNYNSDRTDGGILRSDALKLLSFGTDVTLNYNTGTYNPGNVWGDTNEGLKDIPIYVPGDLSDILNANPDDILGDVAPSWAGDVSLKLPTVSNPSINVDTSVGFPNGDKSLKTPVTLNQEATILDVVVPLSLPVSVDRDGVVTVANNVEVVNNSNGPIKISDVSIQSKDGWTLSDFDKDYSAERVGLKEYSFKIEGQEIRDSITLDRVVNGLDKCSISYDSNISPQKESIVGSNIADVVFTIDWYEN